MRSIPTPLGIPARVRAQRCEPTISKSAFGGAVKRRFRFFLLAALFSLSCDFSHAISEGEARNAIRVLLQNPNSSQARTAGRVVLEFAEATPDHKILINLGYLPWAKSRSLPDGSQMLLAAFVAGNLQEQMRKRTSDPEPYYGILAIIEVYQKMQQNNPNFKIAKVGEFIAMEKKGVLQTHIASIK